MLKLNRTNFQHEDFVALVKRLDAELAERDGAEHAFYNQFNKIDSLQHVVIAYKNGWPAACGAIKSFDKNSAEIKRMYTQVEHRGYGIAQQLLAALETWAEELGFKHCILETGTKQPEAIALYLKCGYTLTENYGQYKGVENSRCFKKKLL